MSGYLNQALGPHSSEVVTSMMAAQGRKGGLITTIIGIVTLFLGASGVFGQLKMALNVLWGVEAKPGRAVLVMLVDRLASVLVLLGIGLLLLVSMAVTTLITALSGQIQTYIQIPGAVVQALNLGISLGLLTLLFMLIFKLLPDVRIPWRDLWLGALCTAVLFLLGEFLLSLYLGRRGTTSAYGAAGSVVLILMWIYYSALILLLGAEFTKVYARQSGAHVEPGRFAVPAPHGFLAVG